MYKFIESNYKQNQEFFNSFIETLSYNIESFQEEHILKSKVFSIFIEDVHHGYFAFCENTFDIEGFTVLTQFVLNSKVLKHSHPIFKKVFEEYNIISALVSSMDEMLLSISMDFHKSVTMQAFLHEDGKFEAAQPEFPRSSIVLTNEEDFGEIQRLSKNFFDFLKEPRKKDMYELYMLKNEDAILGFGLLEYGEIVKDVRSLGIYTIEEHRQKGVGRSMMMHLKDICYEQGVKPLTGCNWYNKRSKATLDSAGFIPKTRLFRVEFTEDEKWVSI